MRKKPKPKLPRSPLPKKTGGPHKTARDYDRRKWRKSAADDTTPDADG